METTLSSTMNQIKMLLATENNKKKQEPTPEPAKKHDFRNKKLPHYHKKPLKKIFSINEKK